jgi:hypothetical protein
MEKTNNTVCSRSSATLEELLSGCACGPVRFHLNHDNWVALLPHEHEKCTACLLPAERMHFIGSYWRTMRLELLTNHASGGSCSTALFPSCTAAISVQDKGLAKEATQFHPCKIHPYCITSFSLFFFEKIYCTTSWWAERARQQFGFNFLTYSCITSQEEQTRGLHKL